MSHPDCTCLTVRPNDDPTGCYCDCSDTGYEFCAHGENRADVYSAVARAIFDEHNIYGAPFEGRALEVSYQAAHAVIRIIDSDRAQRQARESSTHPEGKSGRP